MVYDYALQTMTCHLQLGDLVVNYVQMTLKITPTDDAFVAVVVNFVVGVYLDEVYVMVAYD